MILNIMYKIILVTMFIVIIILFFLNIFSHKIDETENISFTFEELTPAAEVKKTLVSLSIDTSEI